MRMRRVAAIGAFLGLLGASAPPTPALAGDGCPRTGEVRTVGRITSAGVDEISGLVASGRRRRLLWVHEDSGNPTSLLGYSPAGRRRARVAVRDASNFDWEDIARAAGTLWIGDIGDNASIRNEIRVWWFPEPGADRTSVRARMLTLHYPGGSAHNAEALIVHGRRARLYVFTKEAGRSRVFAAEIDQLRDGATRRLRRVATLGDGIVLHDVTAADLGPRGIVVKASDRGFLYRWTRSRRVRAALVRRPCRIPVGPGEALGFSRSGRAWYSIPEGARPRISRTARR
jgi:hypothetical protein